MSDSIVLSIIVDPARGEAEAMARIKSAVSSRVDRNEYDFVKMVTRCVDCRHEDVDGVPYRHIRYFNVVSGVEEHVIDVTAEPKLP